MDLNGAAHYAEAWSSPPGCWQMVSSALPGACGAPRRCHEPVTFRGRFTDCQGMTNAVESCDDHTADLVLAVPVEGGGLRALLKERLDED
jgi:hypothetical protein